MVVNAVYSQSNSVKTFLTVGRVRALSLVFLLQISFANLPHAFTSSASSADREVTSSVVRLTYLFRSMVFRDSLLKTRLSSFSASSGNTMVLVP